MNPMKSVTNRRPMPLRAFVISVAAMAIPPVSQAVLPAAIQEQYGLLLWTTILVPAFFLAYYRGTRGIAEAVAAGMAILALTQAAVLALGKASPDWTLIFIGLAVYLGICGALAVMLEKLHRDQGGPGQLPMFDTVTGLPNRRFLDMMLQSQFAAAVRGRGVVAVLFDIDQLARVSRDRGREAGDGSMRAFADVLRRHTRRMDFSGHLGADKFVAVLSDSNVEKASVFANRVLADFRDHPMPWGKVTASGGIAAYEDGMRSHEVLLAAADTALVRARKAGGDRIVTAEPSPPPPVPAARRSIGSPTPPGTSGRILVVDDDANVLRAVTRMLEAGGYSVEFTSQPDLVLRRYATGAAHDVDLLVTDVIMPDMTGIVLVEQVLSYRPDLRVVYISGYVQKDGLTWPGLPGAVVGFVPKPIEMQHLLDTVEEALARPLPAPK
jgi:diguanylate cyclase (GGDEF)-like protein